MAIIKKARPGHTRVYLAFAGFYESQFSAVIEDVIQQDADEVDFYLGEDAAAELCTLPNHGALCNEIAKDYCRRFGDWLEIVTNDLAGVVCDPVKGLAFDFCELYRPKDYCFETDCIEAEIKTADLRRLYAWIERYHAEEWRYFFAERTKSRDGFLSFYDAGSPDAYGLIEQWPIALTQLIFDFIDSEAEILDEELRSDAWYCGQSHAYELVSEALYSTSDRYVDLLNRADSVKDAGEMAYWK